jgi:hypothetical protein
MKGFFGGRGGGVQHTPCSVRGAVSHSKSILYTYLAAGSESPRYDSCEGRQAGRPVVEELARQVLLQLMVAGAIDKHC